MEAQSSRGRQSAVSPSESIRNRLARNAHTTDCSIGFKHILWQQLCLWGNSADKYTENKSSRFSVWWKHHHFFFLHVSLFLESPVNNQRSLQVLIYDPNKHISALKPWGAISELPHSVTAWQKVYIAKQTNWFFLFKEMLSTYLPNFRKITLQHNLLCHTYKMVLISNSEINSWSLLLQFVLFYGNIPLSNFSKLGVYPHKAVSQSLFCLLVYLVL